MARNKPFTPEERQAYLEAQKILAEQTPAFGVIGGDTSAKGMPTRAELEQSMSERVKQARAKSEDFMER